eukprot:761108-Hanusia_phi.AAC.1
MGVTEGVSVRKDEQQTRGGEEAGHGGSSWILAMHSLRFTFLAHPFASSRSRTFTLPSSSSSSSILHLPFASFLPAFTTPAASSPLPPAFPSPPTSPGVAMPVEARRRARKAASSPPRLPSGQSPSCRPSLRLPMSPSYSPPTSRLALRLLDTMLAFLSSSPKASFCLSTFPSHSPPFPLSHSATQFLSLLARFPSLARSLRLFLRLCLALLLLLLLLLSQVDRVVSESRVIMQLFRCDFCTSAASVQRVKLAQGRSAHRLLGLTCAAFLHLPSSGWAAQAQERPDRDDLIVNFPKHLDSVIVLRFAHSSSSRSCVGEGDEEGGEGERIGRGWQVRNAIKTNLEGGDGLSVRGRIESRAVDEEVRLRNMTELQKSPLSLGLLGPEQTRGRKNFLPPGKLPNQVRMKETSSCSSHFEEVCSWTREGVLFQRTEDGQGYPAIVQETMVDTWKSFPDVDEP